MFEKIKALDSFSKTDLASRDWLIEPVKKPSKLCKNQNGDGLVLTNGLISRKFQLKPNCSCVAFNNDISDEAAIRGVKPESELIINGKSYPVGGLKGQNEYAYFRPEWVNSLEKIDCSFQIQDFNYYPIKPRIKWKQKRWVTNKQWPPKGITLELIYKHNKFKDFEVSIYYSIYDGLPLISKWFEIRNNSKDPVLLNSFKVEILACVEQEGFCQGDAATFLYPNLHIETDYAFSAMSPKTADAAIFWEEDPDYTSQVAYNSDAPILLECKPPIGPEISIKPGAKFESFRVYELLFDSTCRERKTLAMRKMYRVIAPWVTENPIFMHVVTADPEKIKIAIDQAAEVGFEMVIISFGSGLNMEWEFPEFYEEYRELFEYAHKKGIEIGSYSLFSSRSVGKENDVVDPETGKTNVHATFGQAPCLCSHWGLEYLRKIKIFMKKTNADFLEHDGPYPGDVCASEQHPGHKNVKDSQWKQWRAQVELYRWINERGGFINAPDWYFLNGTNKTGIGYKEINWSLPRERQVIIARQNIFDGTWEKTPSMGWIFTPLTPYHKVGEWKKSTLEPLSEHLEFYEHHLSQNFLSGVQSCYRGLRLYDSEKTKKAVKQWVDLYKQYRDILNADIIHFRRPDGQHIDGFIHVDPGLENKAFAVFYNPLDVPVEEKLSVPLYYAGFTKAASVLTDTGDVFQTKITRNYCAELTVKIDASSRRWYVFRAP